MATKVAVVTGSNKGIGFAIVRGLCKAFQGDVYLTARNEDNGKKAIAELEAEGLKPKFHQLDITDLASIQRLKEFLVKNYGGLDILVNNAGIAYKGDSTAPFSEQAEVTMKTNFNSTLDVCNILLPILRSGARVVNVSSMVSTMALSKCSPQLQKHLKSISSIAEVEKSMQQFVEYAKAGTHEKEGWPNTAYGASKMGVTVMTPILQTQVDADTSRDDIIINSCCPGYVDTDMTSHKGPLTIDQGAETPLYCALLPPKVSEPKGEFLQNKKVTHWKA
jgi:carbonyl reductase 1